MQHARVVALLANRREMLAGVRGIDCRFLARIGLPRLRLPQLRACCLPPPTRAVSQILVQIRWNPPVASDMVAGV